MILSSLLGNTSTTTTSSKSISSSLETAHSKSPTPTWWPPHVTLLSNGSVFACIVVIFHCDKVFFCVLFLSRLSSNYMLDITSTARARKFKSFFCFVSRNELENCFLFSSRELPHFEIPIEIRISSTDN
uniref:(northern house mosquito) hypothetical protein n=1 Tax=Culex pipiens TaxID=7175 RepID=A0A8D8F4G0_CULPI